MYFAASCGLEWQEPQVSGRCCLLTGDCGSVEGRAACAEPWQLWQVGTSALPWSRARPWTLARYCSTSVAWQVAQNCGAGDGFRHVVGAVAGDAGLRVVGIAQSRMSAGGHLFGGVGVAGDAGGGSGFRAVRLRCGSGVAIDAAEAAVWTLHVRGGIDGDVFALGVLQAGGGTVAEQAVGGCWACA